jgi:hypothetical protein
MNKQILTVLGCSSSIALSLLSGNAVRANTSEYVFTAPEIEGELADIPQSQVDYPFYDCSCSEYDAATAEEVDREGDKAIARYGCDCAGCRRLVSNLDKTEKTIPSIVK